MSRSHTRHIAVLAVACTLLGRCRCIGGAPADGGSDAFAWFDASADVWVARTPDLEELWTRAKDGDDDELERLADREGERGLEERAVVPAFRLTALRAMAFSPGFSSLPMLGGAAEHGADDEARAAVESADAIAARKHAQTDVEDREELQTGCASLLVAAKDAARPRPVRVGAVRALRMLVDAYKAGCANRVDIPTDVDAR